MVFFIYKKYFLQKRKKVFGLNIEVFRANLELVMEENFQKFLLMTIDFPLVLNTCFDVLLMKCFNLPYQKRDGRPVS